MPVPQIQGLAARNPSIQNPSNRREGPQKVFVYGSLKKGYHNHEPYLKDCKFLGNAHVEGILFHLGGFPALNLSENFSTVYGEVYEVTWENIIGMDRLEGIAHDFYDRVECRVAPQGVVWTYIFPRERASQRCHSVITSGVWTGRDSPCFEWAGFGKGVIVGSFSTDTKMSEIQVGGGEGKYVLRRSALDSTYKLIHRESGDVVGTGYRTLRDMIGGSRSRRNVIGLPKRDAPLMSELVDTAIKETLKTDGIVVGPPYEPAPRTTPVVWVPPNNYPKEEEPTIPQAARLLNLKYGAA